MNEILIGNRGGIPTVKATQSSAGSSSSDASYSLPDHTFRFVGPSGIIVIVVNEAVTTATGVNIVVNSNSMALTDAEGDALTSITAGDHLLTFNKISNTLKLLV